MLADTEAAAEDAEAAAGVTGEADDNIIEANSLFSSFPSAVGF